MIVLSCNKIHKSFGIDVILEDITFSINEGEKVALVGPNGQGKSTLFKIISGILEHDSGELFLDKGKTLGYLSQHLSLDSSNSIFEEMLLVFENIVALENKMKNLEVKMNEPYDVSNSEYHNKLISDYTESCELYNNVGGYTYKGEIARVLKGLGFGEESFNTPINILSGGQKTRVALCKLLLTKPDVLLLDEPTNHLDLIAIEWLEEYLRDYKGTLILTSHDRFFLDTVTTKTLELINGHVNVYNGNYTFFVNQKKVNYDLQLKAFNEQQAEIKRQEEVIERYRSFNREKSIRAAESRQKALDKIDRIKAPDKDPKAYKLNFGVEMTSGNDVIHIENLSKAFDDKVLFTNLFLDLRRSEKVALVGENGRGKTTLFKIIMDKIKSDTGVKILGKNVQIGYYDQEQSNLNPEKTILDEVWDDFPELTVTEIRSYLGSFLFRGDDVFKEVKKLSGGEKCRINLLKLMLSRSNFLLLDEPTNHLDINSREALEDSLLEYDGTLLVISHDRYFLNKVVEKIYELNIDGAKEFLGNYSYYVEKKKNPLRFEQLEETSGKTKTQIQAEKKKKKEEEKLLREKKNYSKSLEDKISKLEQEVLKLQESLCLEEVYSNPIKSEEVNGNIKSLQSSIDSLYEEWENSMIDI